MFFDRRDFIKNSVAAGLSGVILPATADAQPAEQKKSDSNGKTIVFQKTILIRYEVDVFVAGGGPAGIAAAVSAARQGKKVFLAEKQNCLGGMGTAGMLPAFMPFSDGVNFLSGGIGKEIQSKAIEAGGTGPDSKDSIRSEVLKRVYDQLLLDSGVEFILQAQVIDLQTSSDRVETVILAAKSGIYAVKAKMFIDGTGDGDLCVWAGAPWEMGDGEGNVMAGTLCSLWADIDWDTAKKEGLPFQEKNLEEAFKQKIFTNEDRHLPGMWRVGAHLGGGNIGHTFGVDGTNEVSMTKALVWARKSLMEYERYYKQFLKGFDKMELAATAAMLGIRETRRIMGDYVLNLKDFEKRAVFEDEIGRYSYPVDIHAAKANADDYKKYADDFKKLRYGKGENYGIPYRSLLPQKLSNVWVTGRCISTDRYMQSSIRVMPGCFITGQAAGVASAMAIEKNTNNRGISVKELQERLKKTGAFLPNC